MKKLFLLAFAVCSMFSMNLLAQTSKAELEQIWKASSERMPKIQKFIEKIPKSTGNSEIDKFTTNTYSAAVASAANTELLKNLYHRQIGETVDGVTDVTNKTPTLEEWIALATTLTAEGISIKEASELSATASGAVKELSPLKAATATTAVTKSVDALKIIGEETADSAKAVKDIIETIKSGKNL